MSLCTVRSPLYGDAPAWIHRISSEEICVAMAYAPPRDTQMIVRFDSARGEDADTMHAHAIVTGLDNPFRHGQDSFFERIVTMRLVAFVEGASADPERLPR